MDQPDEKPPTDAGAVDAVPEPASTTAAVVARTLDQMVKARMVIALEDHPVTRQNRRVHVEVPGRDDAELGLSYTLENRTEARFVVTADHPGRVVGMPDTASARLPSPLANDILVALGEVVNQRTRGQRWDVDSDDARTVSWGVAELLEHVGRGHGVKSYAALVETARRLAKVRITATGGAWRRGGKRGRLHSEVIFGLIDRLEIIGRADAPAGARLKFTISKEFARRLAEDFRLMETAGYWALQGDMARRLYRLLDSARHLIAAKRPAGAGRSFVLRVPVAYLRDRLPIDESKTAQVVRKLDNYHKELLDVGFLESEPTYEPCTPDDLRHFPTHPGRGAKLISACYQFAVALAPEAQVAQIAAPVERARVADPVQPSLFAAMMSGPAKAAPPAPAPNLADRMTDLARALPDAMRHIGLCKLAAEALVDEDAWRRCVALARQEAEGIPPVAKLIVEVRAELTRRGLPVPERLYDRATQRALLGA